MQLHQKGCHTISFKWIGTNNNFTVHRFHQVPLTQTERQVGNHRAIIEQPPVMRENCVVVGGFCYCCLLLSEMRWKVFISPKSFLWLFWSLAYCHKCQCLHGRQQLVCKLLPTTCGAVEKLQKLWHKPETENTRLTTVPHCSRHVKLLFWRQMLDFESLQTSLHLPCNLWSNVTICNQCNLAFKNIYLFTIIFK